MIEKEIYHNEKKINQLKNHALILKYGFAWDKTLFIFFQK